MSIQFLQFLIFCLGTSILLVSFIGITILLLFFLLYQFPLKFKQEYK